jgi:hypothetical protein
MNSKFIIIILFLLVYNFGCQTHNCKKIAPTYIYSYELNNNGVLLYNHVLSIDCEKSINLDSTFILNKILEYSDSCNFDIPIHKVEVISSIDGIDFISNSPDMEEIEKRSVFRIIFNLENNSIIDSIYFKRNIPH